MHMVPQEPCEVGTAPCTMA